MDGGDLLESSLADLDPLDGGWGPFYKIIK